MNQPILMEQLAGEILTAYRSDPSQSEGMLEKYLEKKLEGSPPAERIKILEELAGRFERTLDLPPDDIQASSEELTRLFSLLLGHRISSLNLSSVEFREKFVSSLNTIFDTLNQIIGVIHGTLLGRKVELETIRQVIGSSLEQEGKPESLQSHLDQIREAFLVAHRAFQQAAQNKISQILAELDPHRIEAQGEGGLKFGPFLKSDFYDEYKAKFQKCKNWLDSGRFQEELLREFEKICQKTYKGKTGGAP